MWREPNLQGSVHGFGFFLEVAGNTANAILFELHPQNGFFIWVHLMGRMAGKAFVLFSDSERNCSLTHAFACWLFSYSLRISAWQSAHLFTCGLSNRSSSFANSSNFPPPRRRREKSTVWIVAFITGLPYYAHSPEDSISVGLLFLQKPLNGRKGLVVVLSVYSIHNRFVCMALETYSLRSLDPFHYLLSRFPCLLNITLKEENS